MLRLLADEDLTQTLVRELLRREPSLRIVRTRDAGLAGTPDQEILEYAADRGLVVMTHDVRTMVALSYERVRGGLRMPGVIIIPQRLSVGVAIQELLELALLSEEGDLEGRVAFLPLRSR